MLVEVVVELGVQEERAKAVFTLPMAELEGRACHSRPLIQQLCLQSGVGALQSLWEFLCQVQVLLTGQGPEEQVLCMAL
jgi:hypothetical protein